MNHTESQVQPLNALEHPSEQAEGPAGLVGYFNKRSVLLVGLVGSLSLHLLLLVIAAILLVGRGGPGDGPGLPGEVQLAVMTQAELAAMEQMASSAPVIPVPALEQPQVPELETLELQDLSDFSSESALSDRAMESLGAGDLTGLSELATGGGGAGSVSFFGAEASGRRIAFVIDMSGSMAMGGKIEFAQRELARSLQELRAPMEFYVALFNNKGFGLIGFDQWAEATPGRVREAQRAFVHMSTEVGGTTFPVPGFELVFAQRPPPDAVFFMTDGDFSDGDTSTDAILAMVAKHRVPIHCITLVDKSSEPRMRRIAEASGGTYTHIDGTARRGR